jgi:hypothetical protein
MPVFVAMWQGVTIYSTKSQQEGVQLSGFKESQPREVSIDIPWHTAESGHGSQMDANLLCTRSCTALQRRGFPHTASLHQPITMTTSDQKQYYKLHFVEDTQDPLSVSNGPLGPISHRTRPPAFRMLN